MSPHTPAPLRPARPFSFVTNGPGDTLWTISLTAKPCPLDTPAPEARQAILAFLGLSEPLAVA